jgi:porphobilinogen deaminase
MRSREELLGAPSARAASLRARRFARSPEGEGGSTLELTGLVATLDGRRILRDRLAGPIDEPDDLGARLADRLIAAGAREILDEIERAGG